LKWKVALKQIYGWDKTAFTCGKMSIFQKKFGNGEVISPFSGEKEINGGKSRLNGGSFYRLVRVGTVS
jgi:hypothetical protein